MRKLSPMMQQYMEIKNRNKDSILFFRLGDFYEMFFDDAKLVSKELELTLTGKDCGTGERAPMCGIPYHSCDTYIAKLIEKGYKISICEQTEEPAKKGLMKRDVVRLITPGTIYENNLLDESKNNFICSIFLGDENLAFCACDISTGELKYTLIKNDENTREKLKNEFSKFMPSEILFRGKIDLLRSLTDFLLKKIRCSVEVLNDELNSINFFEKKVLEQFREQNDVKVENTEKIICLGQLIDYLSKTQKDVLKRIKTISSYSGKEYMSLSYNSLKNLEIVESMKDQKKFGSLLWVLDKTKTAMGKRLIKNIIKRPLLNIEKINKRLDAVEELIKDIRVLDSVKEELKGIFDLERLLTKVVCSSCNARDIKSIGETIRKLPCLKFTLKSFSSELLKNIYDRIENLKELENLIKSAIVDQDIPLTLKEGGIIKPGFNKDLDEIRNILANAKDYISGIEGDEREKTGILKLKIGYNRIFGYYLEVPNSQKNKVPESYIRKQTLSNCERYITPKLKELEYKILHAKEQINNLEYKIFLDVRNKVAENLEKIQKSANSVARLDVLVSFAEVSLKNEYVRPKITDDGKIILKDSRHPVVELLTDEVLFVPNDVNLDTEENRVALITGPNMAGKSTYMRQIALITIMAQIGCFVPATEASIGIVDSVFTRVGASDDLASGQSTFMVEMTELAQILENASSNSLIILDEIGRGTSTFDGMSIARASLEYIANKEIIGAKTLFSTHYHELENMESLIDGVKNYNIAVKKKDDGIIFLRKIVRGSAKESFGIEVAKLANIPKAVIKRAQEILKDLEYNSFTNSNNEENSKSKQIKKRPDEGKYELNENVKNILNEIKTINVETLTPIEALNVLYKLSSLTSKTFSNCA